ncbi:MAG: hypothetical protein WKG01_01755 [Kofleriaceae bacterium]
MKRHLLVGLFVAGFTTTAAAQVVALDVFLEQRVAEELAADGTILSRLGVALDVESVGDKLLVSLVDPATRRALATTKIDAVPADREAAVAMVTQVVANLTTQLTSSSSTATAVKTVLEDERKHREHKEAAETAFKQEEIRFNDVPIVSGGKDGVSTELAMIPYRGGRRLTPPEFFDAVERPDLTTTYNQRRNGGIGAIVVGSAVAFAGLVVIGTKGGASCDGPYLSDEYDRCRDQSLKWLGISTGLLAGGGLVALGGHFVYTHANPVDKNEAYDLAEKYNKKLRTKHGLPALSQQTRRFHDVAIAPYADAGGGGLTLAGRF